MTTTGSTDTAVHFADFLQRHSLRSNSFMEAEIKAIHWTAAANVLVNQGYATLTGGEFSSQPAVGLLLNLLHRAFEHLDAALVAFVTGSAAASEGISRVTVELSVSILYILGGQRESRLLAFLEDYVNVEQKRIRNWSNGVQSLSEPEREEHIREIDRRGSGIVAMSDVLARLRIDVASAGVGLVKESWPNVAGRFAAIGDVVTYRTVYARMSSGVHSDAEETIRYFIGRICEDPDVLESMGLETIWFSKFLLYFAVNYFLRANSAYATCYGMSEAALQLNRGLVVIDEELRVIAENIG